MQLKHILLASKLEFYQGKRRESSLSYTLYIREFLCMCLNGQERVFMRQTKNKRVTFGKSNGMRREGLNSYGSELHLGYQME